MDKSRTAIFAGLAIALVVVFLVYYVFVLNPTVTSPATVSISGFANTNTVGNLPAQSITFTSDVGGVYTSPVTNGAFQVVVPNNHLYKVMIFYRGLLGTVSCSAGELALKQPFGNGSLIANISC